MRIDLHDDCQEFVHIVAIKFPNLRLITHEGMERRINSRTRTNFGDLLHVELRTEKDVQLIKKYVYEFNKEHYLTVEILL